MRTTVDIREDVLLAAKEIAKSRGLTLGEVLSDLARQSLTRDVELGSKNGIPQLPVRPERSIVTLETVNRLRDEAP